MPVATVSDEPVLHPLKSCPEGFVRIRRMSHGEKMYRQSFASKTRFNVSKKTKDFQGELDMMQERTTLWEYANLIIEHNLTYLQHKEDPSSEAPLDFKRAEHVKMLDPRIAEEISLYIDELNNFESDADDEDSDLGNS